MNSQIYYVNIGSNNHLTNIDTNYHNGWKIVTVPKNRLDYFIKRYDHIVYNNDSKTLDYPSDYNRTIIDDVTTSKDWQDVENDTLNGVSTKELVNDINFTESEDTFGIFDSYNFNLSNNGLLLNSTIDENTGASKPARFRAFGLPLNVNQYAITTVKVPISVMSNGQDFSFWYFNNKNKYGYRTGINDFDNNEFDVDEIHNSKHYATLYAWNQGNTFQVLPTDNDFTNEYHTFAIKWTDNNLSYYLDGKSIFSKDENIIQDTMFPTWEIEVPTNGISSGWGGAINYDQFPIQAVVKDYKVFNL